MATSRTASRLPSTVQVTTSSTTGLVTGTRVLQPQSPVPLRKQVFREDGFKDPKDAARQFNTMQQLLHDATLSSRTVPAKITFEGLIFDSTLGPRSSTAVPIRHGLGTKVRWNVVRWYEPATGTITAAGIYEPSDSQSDTDVLILRPTGGTLGIADIEVWSAC